MESEQATPVDSIKDMVRSSVKVPDKHLKNAGGHMSRNVVEIIIKMKTIVQKPLMIRFTSLKKTFHHTSDSLKCGSYICRILCVYVHVSTYI